MAIVEKTVFISYRRANAPLATAVEQNLTAHGYNVFIDYKIGSGGYKRIIFENIRNKAHFLIILTPSTLDECDKPNDMVRQEIETALKEERNIVPLLFLGFDYDDPKIVQRLKELGSFKEYNGLPIGKNSFDISMEELRSSRWLDKPLDMVLHPFSDDVKKITQQMQAKVGNASPIEKKQLIAQEWFERGHSAAMGGQPYEGIRYLTKAIEFDPEFAAAYSNLGVVYGSTDNPKNQKDAFMKAIKVDPNYAPAHYNLGVVLSSDGNVNEAEDEYRTAIELDPDYLEARVNLAHLLAKIIGREKDALKVYRETIKLHPYRADLYIHMAILFTKIGEKKKAKSAYRDAMRIDPEMSSSSRYNIACLESLSGNVDAAFTWLAEAIETREDRDTAWVDPDLALLREDETRFEEIVGPRPNESLILVDELKNEFSPERIRSNISLIPGIWEKGIASIKVVNNNDQDIVLLGVSPEITDPNGKPMDLETNPYSSKLTWSGGSETAEKTIEYGHSRRLNLAQIVTSGVNYHPLGFQFIFRSQIKDHISIEGKYKLKSELRGKMGKKELQIPFCVEIEFRKPDTLDVKMVEENA